MAILRNDTTVRSADGQTTSAIITAANIGNFGIATNSTYYIGTTQNVFNRASASQTLTGVSIDGNAATVTNGVYTTGAQTIGGTKTFSDGIVVNGASSFSANVDMGTSTGSKLPGHFYTNTYDGSNVYFHIGTSTSTNKILNLRVFDSANNYATYTFNSSGTLATAGDFRAPIFYDSNNTAYYIDPASTSVLNKINLNSAGVAAIQWRAAGVGTISGGFPFYNNASYGSINIEVSDNDTGGLVIDNEGVTVYGAADNGQLFRTIDEDVYQSNSNVSASTTFWINQGLDGGGTIRGSFNATADFRAPIFYDSGDTTYYLDPANTGTALLVAGTIAYKPSVGNNVVIGNDATYGTSGTGRYVGIGFGGLANSANKIFAHNMGEDGLYICSATSRGIYFRANGGSTDHVAITSGGSMGIGTSSPSQKLHVVGNIIVAPASSSWAEGLSFTMPTASTWGGLRWRREVANNDGNHYVGYTGLDSTDDLVFGSNNGGTQINNNIRITKAGLVGIGTIPTQKFHVSGIAYSDTDFRAPIFYDSNDTAYYCDPNGTSRLANLRVYSSFDTASSDVYANMRVIRDAAFTDGLYIGFNNAGTGTTKIFGGGASTGELTKYSNYTLEPGSFRAPIFYDSDNTAYYTDPNGTSVLNRLKIDGGNFAYDWYQSFSDFVNGTLITTDIPASAAEGESFVMEVVGKSYSTSTSPFNFSVQGYLYNSTIISYSGITLDSTGLSTIKIFENGGYLCFWWARVSYWNAFEVSVRAYNSVKSNYNRVTNITDVVEPTGTKKVTVTLQRFMRGDVSATNSVDLRAPIFYDSDNTGYYLNPASTSNLNGLTVAATISGNISGNSATATNVAWTGITGGARTNYDLQFQPSAGGYSGFAFKTSGAGEGGYFLIRATSDTDVYTAEGITLVADAGWLTLAQRTTASRGVRIMTGTTSSERLKVTTAGDFQIVNGNSFTYNGNVVLHAGNYTSYTLPIGGSWYGANLPGTRWNGMSVNGGEIVFGRDLPAVGQMGILVDGCYIAGENNGFWSLGSSNDWGTRRGFYWDGSYLNFTTNSAVALFSDARAPIFYDSDDTAYYLNQASGSNLKYLQVSGAWGSSPFGSGHETFTIRSTYASFCQRQTNGNLGYWLHHIPTDGSYMLYGGRGATDASNWDWSMRAYPNQDGSYVEFRTSARAPIFYDLNDTTYYVDPAASTSINVNGYIISSGTGGNKGAILGNLQVGYAGTYNTVQTPTNADTIWLQYSHSGNVGLAYGGGYTTAYNSIRSPIFYDSNDTTYYIDPASFSLTSSIGIGGLTSSNNVQMYDSYVDASSSYLQSPPLIIRKDSSATGAIDQAPVGLFIYNLNGTNNTWTKLSLGSREAAGAGNTVSIGGLAAQKTAGTANSWATGNLHFWTKAGGTQITNMVAYSAGYVQSDYSFRAPIFYDSNNTAFYVDGAGTSRLAEINIDQGYTYGWWRNWSSGNGIYNQSTGQHFYSDDVSYWNVASSSSSQGIRLRTGGHGGTVRGYFYADTNNDVGILNNAGNWRLRVVGGDYGLADGSSMRAQIFYDSNNTGYYIDAASTSVLSSLTIAADANVELYKSQTVDMSNTTTYSTSNYYPVTIPVLTEGCIIQIQNNLNSNVPSWSTHGAGFTLNLKWRTNASGWGTTDVRRYVEQYHERFANQTICGGITQMTNSSIEVVWLRGGGQYLFKFSRNLTATAQSSTFTSNSQSVSPTSSAQNAIWDSVSGYEKKYNNTTLSTDSMYTPVLYDYNNTAYYIDAASTSNLVGLTVANTITGSISGNAVTAGGLAVHTGTNNEANKIVRTDGNGYLNAGWINTPSGDMADTATINRIYCSDDNYIRYKGVADFQQQIGLTYKYSTPRSANTTDTNYWVGTMGWGTTDLNTIFDYGCGFFDSWSNPGNQPSGSSHWNGIQSIHYTNGSSRYGWQMVVGAGSPAYTYIRGTWGTSFGSWYLMWNSANDGAGSGLDADLLDGYNSATANTANTIVLRDGSGNFSAGTITATLNGSSTSCTGNSATVTINYNNDSNSTYQMLWGAGNNVYGTAGVYLNPSTDYVYATSFNASDWFRSSGATGWYNSTYGGGIYMNDTTWVRVYNNKYFYCDTIIQAGSDMRSPIYYDANDTNYYVDPASTSNLLLVKTRNTFGQRIAVTASSPITIDTQYSLTQLTLTGSISSMSFSNIQADGIVHMWTIVTVGNATAYTITWPAAVKWPGGTAPTVTTTNTKRDIYQFVTYDGGTNIYAIIVGQNL